MEWSTLSRDTATNVKLSVLVVSTMNPLPQSRVQTICSLCFSWKLQQATMEETAIMFRDVRALLRHAKKVQSGTRVIGNGQDEEEFCVELGISWISWWFQVTLPTTGVSEMSRRKELTAYLSPETISTILSMGSLKKVEIRYLLLSQRTPLSLAESHLLSVSLSNCRNLAHLDLSEKYDTTYEFCLAPHTTQLGESLKN